MNRDVRILHTADFQYQRALLNYRDLASAFVADTARAHRCSLIILAGDFWDHSLALEDAVVSAGIRAVQGLAGAAPVLILQGTRSHDIPGSLDIFRRLQTTHPVAVADAICQTALLRVENGGYAFTAIDAYETVPPEAIALLSCFPPPPLRALRAEGADPRQWTRLSMEEFAVQNASAEIPCILAAHGAVEGAVTPTGFTFGGASEVAADFTLEDLKASRADYVALGHVHAAQEWGHIHYSGSPISNDWSELQEKCVKIARFEGRALRDVTRIVTPSPRRVIVRLEPGQTIREALAGAQTTCALVKVEATVPEHEAPAFDRSAITRAVDGAYEVQVEVQVSSLQQTVRCPAILESRSLSERVTLWANQRGLPNGNELTERARLIEAGHSPDAIVDEILVRGAEKSPQSHGASPEEEILQPSTNPDSALQKEMPW